MRGACKDLIFQAPVYVVGHVPSLWQVWSVYVRRRVTICGRSAPALIMINRLLFARSLSRSPSPATLLWYLVFVVDIVRCISRRFYKTDFCFLDFFRKAGLPCGIDFSLWVFWWSPAASGNLWYEVYSLTFIFSSCTAVLVVLIHPTCFSVGRARFWRRDDPKRDVLAHSGKIVVIAL